MKKTILYAASVAFLALGMTACGAATEEAVTYELDATATTLEWKGDYADGTHSHTGTIALADGSMTFAGENFEKGSFNADLSTIKSELTPETGANDLIGHLSSPDFFNSAAFPKVAITVNSVSATEIDATLAIAGKKLATKIPVKTTKTADSFTAKGDFTVDFSSLNLNGFKADLAKEKETGKKDQFVKPVVGFKLNLKLKAAAKK